jgi:hypothetical protein
LFINDISLRLVGFASLREKSRSKFFCTIVRRNGSSDEFLQPGKNEILNEQVIMKEYKFQNFPIPKFQNQRILTIL